MKKTLSQQLSELKKEFEEYRTNVSDELFNNRCQIINNSGRINDLSNEIHKTKCDIEQLRESKSLMKSMEQELIAVRRSLADVLTLIKEAKVGGGVTNLAEARESTQLALNRASDLVKRLEHVEANVRMKSKDITTLFRSVTKEMEAINEKFSTFCNDQFSLLELVTGERDQPPKFDDSRTKVNGADYLDGAEFVGQ